MLVNFGSDYKVVLHGAVDVLSAEQARQIAMLVIANKQSQPGK